MKNKISKILGIAVTLGIVLSFVMALLPSAAVASPDETINEWYKFAYPKEGEDGDWFYDPRIIRDGEITEAIDGTLYVHVQFCLDAKPATPEPDPFTFKVLVKQADVVSVTQFGGSQTGMVTGSINGTWDGPKKDFVAFLNLFTTGPKPLGTACVRGTLTATKLTFQGSIETLTTGVGIGGIVGTYDVVKGDSLTIGACGFSINGKAGDLLFNGFTDIGASIFKSDDGGRTWEDTGYPGGAVVDMAASSLDADILYVTDGHYVYKTDDAGDTWGYVARESLEEALAGYCGIPPCCQLCFMDYYKNGSIDCCPACPDMFVDMFSCPITSIDVGYDADDNPNVFIGTRKHSTCVDLVPAPDGDKKFECIPGDVYFIAEARFQANWTSLNLPCFHGPNGNYDVIAVGCAPDFADHSETYAVITTDDEKGDENPGDDPHTWVVYTTGTVCGWFEFGQLLWDCLNPFCSILSSRIAFPDDWEELREDDVLTLFAGVVDCDYCSLPKKPGCPPKTGGPGGDVYQVVESVAKKAVDLNVLGTVGGGCIGVQPVDIISLDIKGNADEASLIAGAWCCNKVYYSTDGGWTWDASVKDPTGMMDTYVIWYEDTALAATLGTECAVSMACVSDEVEDVGESWNQISLISTDIDSVLYIDHSPGYVCESSTMYMLTHRRCPEKGPMFDVAFLENFVGEGCFCFPCVPGPGKPCEWRCWHDIQSLFRYDGEYWERVYTNFLSGTDDVPWQLQRVRVSPDFNETNCVYLTNQHFEMWRTLDAGCSWDKLKFPCAPRPWIGAAEVINKEIVIAGGKGANAGTVYKTTRHGTRPWSEYDLPAGAGNANYFALEPGYEDPGSMLLGDDIGHVYISEDGGETWDTVGTGTTTGCVAVLTKNAVWVAFDPDYAINHTIYAAAGDNIARCIIDPAEDWIDQEWEWIGGETGEIYVGMKTAGDTALYVTNKACAEAGALKVTVSGTIAVKCAVEECPWSGDLVLTDKEVTTISGTFKDGELVSIIDWNLVCDFAHALMKEPYGYCECEGIIVGDIAIKGVNSGATGQITISPDQYEKTVTGGYCHCCYVCADVIAKGGFEKGGLAAWKVGGLGGHVEILDDTNWVAPNSISATEGSHFVLLSTGKGNINPVDGPDIDGSGYPDSDTATLSQTFTVSPSEVPIKLSFDWDFLTAEEDQPDIFDDFFMVTLNGKRILTGSVYDLTGSPFTDVPDTDDLIYEVSSPGLTNGSYFNWGRSTWQSFGYEINTPGVYTLEFLVADNGNHVKDSGLLIDNIQLGGKILTHCQGPAAIEVVSSFLRADVTGAVAGAQSCVMRSLNPDAEDADDVVFEHLTKGLGLTNCLRHLWLTCDKSDEGCAENVLWSLEQYYANPQNIWVYEDTLAAPIVQTTPVEGQVVAATEEVTLSWKELCGADAYEVSLTYCPECPVEIDVPGFPKCVEDTCIKVTGLEPGETYTWKVRVCKGEPKLSKWSEERTFTTKILGVPFVDLCSPPCGSQDIILTPNFAWGAVEGATGYEVEVATTETFTAGVIKGKTTVNAWLCPETLEYSTTYYWRVRAEKDGVFSDWTYCMFTTMARAVPPPPPVEVTVPPPTPAPQLVIPPAQMITPTWIYAIIGVGGALAIVVIVLIVRTRRPPA